MSFRTALLALVALLAAVVTLSCSNGGQGAASTPSPGEVVVYSGREESLVGPILQEFERSTGIRVQVKYASSGAMAATILEEGDRSPADVFFSSDPGALGAVAGRLSPLPERILGRVSPDFRARDGRWVGVTGRARVVVYNPERVQESELPASIQGFVDPKWRGRIGWAPTNGSFQAMVTAMRLIWGEDATRSWLDGIRANSAKEFANNTAIVDAVAKGEIDVGFVNHYYLFALQRSQGSALKAKNYYTREDPGAVILVAGAGILSTAKNRTQAESLLEFLLSPVAQQYFATQTFEYPLVAGVITPPQLTPLAELKPPSIDLSRLADLDGTLRLLRAAGVIP
jgi:iron(III) transport system substrate-binding protein